MKKSIALIFPGQGSQKVGMGKELYESHDKAKDVFEEVDDALNEKLSEIIFNGDEEKLKLTANAQPALMAVSIALVKVLECEIGKKITSFTEIVLGHSLGEYSSLCSIGSIDISSTAKVLKVRGNAMQNSVKSIETRMIAVIGLELEKIEEILNKFKNKEFLCEIANDNCPGQIILSGLKKSVTDVEKQLIEAGARSIIDLKVSAPFHCSLMKSASLIMEKALEDINLIKPKIKFINNVTADFVDEPKKIIKNLIEQVYKRVRWRESIIKVSKSNIDTIVEIGSGKVLTGLNKRMKINQDLLSISTMKDIENFILSYEKNL